MSHTALEERLRSELDEAARAVPVSADAWQEHRRRLSAHRGQRRRVWAAAAAAVAVLIVAAVAMVGRHPEAALPVSPDQQWTGVFTMKAPDGPVAAQVQLTHQFCGQLVFGPQAQPGVKDCWPLGDGATGVGSDPIAIGSVGTLHKGAWIALVGSVSPDVDHLQVWLADGDSDKLPLTSLDGGQRGFGLVGNGGTRIPQRIVAYDQTGKVLQAADVLARFGDPDPSGAIPVPRSACLDHPWSTLQVRPTGGPTVHVDVGTNDALLTVGGVRSCTAQLSQLAIAASAAAKGVVVVLVTPETESVRLMGSGSPQEVSPGPMPNMPWKVAVLQGAVRPDSVLEAYDGSGALLSSASIAAPSAAN